jgi:hypothetical protein
VSERVRLLPLVAVVALAAAALAACGGGDGGGGGAAEHEILVDLAAQGAQGTTGTATLAKSGDKTSVLVDIIIVSGVGGQIAAIHKGTCAKFDEKEAYLIGDVEEGVGGTTLDVSTEALLEGGYVVVVHQSKQDPTPISCGPIAAS